MKSSYRFLIHIILATALILSCSKKEDNDDMPTTTETYESLDAVFDRMAEKQKLYTDIAPIDLPDYVLQSNDTMMQEIVSIAALIDSSREISTFPAIAPKTTSTKKSINNQLDMEELLSDGSWEEQCYLENTDFGFCTYTGWENNGKLKMVYTQQNNPEYWIIHYRLDGTDSKGKVYDNFMVQIWLTKKDLTYSDYIYNTIFYPESKCGAGMLWQFITEVEDNGIIYFNGDKMLLTTHTYTIITHDCGVLEDYHHIRIMNKVVLNPDRSIHRETWNYSLRIHTIYKWIDYYCSPDGSWSKTVYNDYGNAIDHAENTI